MDLLAIIQQLTCEIYLKMRSSRLILHKLHSCKTNCANLKSELIFLLNEPWCF